MAALLLAMSVCLWEELAMADGAVVLYGFEREEELQAIAEANDAGLGLEGSDEHVRAGGRSLRVTLGRRGHGEAAPEDEYMDASGRVRVLRIPNPAGQDWRGSRALCFDIYNPNDELFAIDLDISDGRSEGYHRGYYETRWQLVPGWTSFVVGLGESFRRGELKEEAMDLADMRMVQLQVRAGIWGERELFVSNVRLEPTGDQEAALEQNRRAAEAFLAKRMATPERKAAEAAAESLQRKIEEAKTERVDTIYGEAMLFAARVGLDWRARMAWFSGGEQQRVIHDYVRDVCARAESELEEVMAGKRRPRTLKRHTPQELSLRGAYWYADGEPVLVTAMLYNNDGPLMRFFHPANTLPCIGTTAGATRYDVERTPLYEAFKKHPETHRVGYDDWCGHLIRDRWSMGGGNEEVVICLESPHMKWAMAQAIQEKTRGLAADPNMLVHVMEGELSYCCYCEYTQRLFREWLIERHGSLEAINATWGTSYSGLEEVRTPHHKEWDGNRARWYDFVDFNQHRFTQHHAWAKAQVRKVDPFTPTTVGGIYYLFSPRQGLLGVDTEAWVDQVCEAAEAEAGHHGVMPTDFLWAVCEGSKPIIDLEYHSDVFSWWPHFLHGYGALAMWFWPGFERTQHLDSSVPHSPYIPLEEVERLLVNALDIQRLGRYITAFPAARSPLALLYSRSSLLQEPPDVARSNAYANELTRLYHATCALDAGRTFVTERDLEQGQAGRFRVVAVPDARHLTEGAFARLVEFVRGGGTLLVMGDALRADQYMRSRDYLAQLGLEVEEGWVAGTAGDRSPERQPFGPGEEDSSPWLDTDTCHFAEGDLTLVVGRAARLEVNAPTQGEVVARFEDEAPALVRTRLGDGWTYYAGTRLGDESLLALVERLLAEAGVEPIVRVRAADGSRLRDVEARSVEQAGEVLLYVINPRRERLELRLETQRRFAEVEDLRRLERRAYDGKLEVPARDTALFRLS